MFEKEAEERARKLEESQILGVYDNDEDLARDIAWDEGKVAGYEEGFKDGAEFGYNKANEWHEIESKVTPKREISKQYMPKNEERYLIYHEDWEKLEAVKQKLIKEGFKVRVWNVIEEEEDESN